MDEWRKTFGEAIPVRLQKKYKDAADYMLYLWEHGELPEIGKPLAYLKSMIKKGFPETGWSRFEERLKRREELERKRREQEEAERREREEGQRLREEWEALPDTEKQKWVTEAEKSKHLKLFSGDMKGFLAWMEAKNKTSSNK